MPNKIDAITEYQTVLAEKGDIKDECGIIEIVLTTSKTKGSADLIENICGIYLESGKKDDKVRFKCAGAIWVNKEAGGIWKKLQPLYYKASSSCITHDKEGNILCGFALENATIEAIKGLIQLCCNKPEEI